jgi:hypothetical protein
MAKQRPYTVHVSVSKRLYEKIGELARQDNRSLGAWVYHHALRPVIERLELEKESKA